MVTAPIYGDFDILGILYCFPTTMQLIPKTTPGGPGGPGRRSGGCTTPTSAKMSREASACRWRLGPVMSCAESLEGCGNRWADALYTVNQSDITV